MTALVRSFRLEGSLSSSGFDSDSEPGVRVEEAQRRRCHGHVDHGIRRCLGVDGEAPDERRTACSPEPVEVGQGCSVDVIRDLAHLGAHNRRRIHFEMYDDFRAEKFAEANLPSQATVVGDVARDRCVLEVLGPHPDDDVPAQNDSSPAASCRSRSSTARR